MPGVYAHVDAIVILTNTINKKVVSFSELLLLNIFPSSFSESKVEHRT